jgi:hypothetical protein
MPRVPPFPIAKSKQHFAAGDRTAACRSIPAIMSATRRFIYRSHARARLGRFHSCAVACARRSANGASRIHRSSLAGLIRAALIAILVTTRKLRQDLAKDRIATRSHHNFVKKPRFGVKHQQGRRDNRHGD